MSSTQSSTPTEPIQVTDQSDLTDATSEHKVVLVDFYADWCGPCKMMEPTIESLANETDAAVVKVDVDAFQQLASQHGVQGVPTLLVFVDGELVERQVGALSEEHLASMIEKYTS